MKVVSNTRHAQGTGASRRLRGSGKVPGIIYGGSADPVMIELDHNTLYHALRVEAFHASILDMEVDGNAEQVLLRSVQWHPFRQQITHIDFQRVSPDRKITMKVPLHFTNQEISPAVKLSAAIVSHVFTELTISCLPANLPEYVEVDLSNLAAGANVHVLDIAMPAGVSPVLRKNENPVIVTVTVPVVEEVAPAAATPSKKKK